MLRAMDALRNMVVGLTTHVPTSQGNRPYINFDNAASTPPLHSVAQAVYDFLPWYASVHRGNGLKSRLSTAVYEQAREVVSRFVGANPTDHVVIFGKNTTEAINKLAYRLQLHTKDIVLIGHLEHHSNDLPWRTKATVRRIGLTPDGGLDHDHFNSLLSRYAGRVRLVAISGASNVTGHLPDIHWFAQQAHQAGAEIFVDCAQLAAHRPIRMRRLHEPDHLDYIAISAHKMYAPFGTGALIGRRDTFERGAPEYSGGGTISAVTAKTVDWARTPDSDEAGSPNVVGAVALARAAQTIQQIGLDVISTHETGLTAYALQKLKRVPGINLYGDSNPARAASRTGVIPFNLGDKPSHLVAAILGHEWGIGVRSGCFCAQPYVMSLLGLSPKAQQLVRHNILHQRRDLAPGMVRISFGLYNTQAEIDSLVEALTAISHDQHGAYQLNAATGQYTPVNYAKDFSPYFAI